MRIVLEVGDRDISYAEATDYIFLRRSSQALRLNSEQRVASTTITSSESVTPDHIRYLTCGMSSQLSRESSRATLFIQFLNLSRSQEQTGKPMLKLLHLMLEKDLIPVIPRLGSHITSGDFMGLAYIARALSGGGEFYCGNRILTGEEIFKSYNLIPYTVSPRELDLLTRGKPAMLGMALVNLERTRELSNIVCSTQAWITSEIPAALGPITDSCNLIEKWIASELGRNSEQQGIYVSSGMFLLKACIAQLANSMAIEVSDFIASSSDHRVCGLRQSIAALTAEVISPVVAAPGILSRHSSVDNSASDCELMIDKTFNILSMYLIWLMYQVKGVEGKKMNDQSRELLRLVQSMVSLDHPLEVPLDHLVHDLKSKLLDRLSGDGSERFNRWDQEAA